MNAPFCWKKEWLPILSLVLLLRVIYSLLGWLVASGPAPEPLAAGPVYDLTASLLSATPLMEKLVNVWWRWDTPYYLSIATQGYSIEQTQAFPPLYPILIRWMRFLIGGDYLLSALLISNLAALAAGILLYEVACFEGLTAPGALRSTVSLFLFPTAFFLFAGYAESLFLALSLSTWLLARQRKWVLAGLAGALAALTRFPGVLLSPVLLWMYFATCSGAQNAELGQPAWKHRLNCLAKPAWLGTLLPAAALALTLLWTHSPTQSGTPSDVLASYWGIQMVAPWEGFRLFFERLIFTPRVFIDWIDLSLFLIMLAACILGLFRLDPAFSLYSWLYIGLLMMRGTPPHLLDSFSRYFLALFPAFLLLGRIGHRWGLIILWIVSFALQIILSWGFLQWKWVA